MSIITDSENKYFKTIRNKLAGSKRALWDKIATEKEENDQKMY